MAKYSNSASYFVNADALVQWTSVMSHGSVIPTATFTTLLENELVLVEKEKEFIGEVVTLKSNQVCLFWRSMEVTILSERLKRLSFFLSVSEFSSLPCFLVAGLVSSACS